MRTTLMILTVLAISNAACLPPPLLARRDRCHQAAEHKDVTAWCGPPEAKPGEVKKCKVEVLPQDRICPQELFQ